MIRVNKTTLDFCLQAREVKESFEDILMLEKRGKPTLTSCERDNIRVGLDKVEEILKEFWRS